MAALLETGKQGFAKYAGKLDTDTGGTVRELALHVLDILQNAVEAGATRVELTIDEDQPGDRLTIIMTR